MDNSVIYEDECSLNFMSNHVVELYDLLSRISNIHFSHNPVARLHGGRR